MRLTFGRYIPLNSPVHKMDPRFKLLMIILLIIAIFFPVGYTGYLFLSATIFSLYLLARLRWTMLFRLLLPAMIIFVVILIINIFLMKLTGEMTTGLLANQGDYSQYYHEVANHGYSGYLPGPYVDILTEKGPEILKVTGLGHFYHWKAFWFSEKALYSALLMAWRIFLMITLTTIITGTTQPLEITLGLEDLLSPLKLIGIPVYILSTIISIALRMIPTLMDEAGRIMKAQASRGIDIKNGSFKDKGKGLVSLIIPLLVSSFQKAEDLAYAMDARGYDPHAARTRFHQFSFSVVDLIIFAVGTSMGVLMIVYSQVYPTTSALMHLPYIDVLTAY
ncbi:Energy-coupling factor transporter transmembrane protein EcfT [Mesoplasma sp. JKS002658]|uniref:energy-coupling factor transporter transmembrane component T family protein n=1 Tax=Mesoplasma whartonense TaxID=2878854 RepID=UPI002022A6E5|nr:MULTISPECIES: energy-coupling factor transporter transmembrane component T [unclassified Mesoplasma]MCL8211359.1 Energy-coupling factor transporter transmembrane protein EcfT [Mesoplasma sp. JKS002664]MCL8212212.1 Energy-coupling factor transporter transmembrane protein EcfT [Mesoplasma sp. JKS002662]MCL8214259.1 Energy-coupling factor transporter transmembrane protein EcfT [Mesoplasma sp. JKS002658]MCL8214697.1 Energy-coupling factor transporter transmembrane protein EcfT [Mesoplasma sp. JK